MAKKSATPAQNMLDAIRPAEADGPLRSAVLSTYGLSLDQPNFFEHDFLPTLLGIGGVRDRGYVAPIAMERKLAECYCALICDAHALSEGARPSLRVDVIAIARPLHHAKITLIHRQRLIRVIISSANLTHDGYRSQREIAAVLDFRPDGGLPPSILDNLVRQWTAALGAAATGPIRTALSNAVTAAENWLVRPTTARLPELQVVFGGGATPLWRQLAEAWPIGEPVLFWRICSPFWPGAESQMTPFEAIAKGLQQRDASLAQTELDLICPPDVAGDRARPVFPFALLQHLRDRKFPITRGRLVPARLEALESEVPDRKAEGHRQLHAKFILLRGPQTAVAFIGSANFTNTGLVAAGTANIEAGILITCPVEMLRESEWLPPLVEAGAVDWSTCGEGALTPPIAEPDDSIDWPAHIHYIDLDIHWAGGPDPTGSLVVAFAIELFEKTTIYVPQERIEAETLLLAKIDILPVEVHGHITIPLNASAVRRLLVRRSVFIQWGDPARNAAYPINVKDAAKSGLPSVLGARPDEQQLLAYFHGRIGEDDLISILEQRAQQMAAGGSLSANEGPPAEFQSYLIREFVESLYGLEEMLKTSLHSPRALEMALLGEFSPAALAERVVNAMRSGRRSAMAAAFQLAELARVIVGLPLSTSEADQNALVEVLNRSISRLMEFVAQAACVSPFAETLRDSHFAAYVRASLPRESADQFLSVVDNPKSSAEQLPTEVSHDCAT